MPISVSKLLFVIIVCQFLTLSVSADLITFSDGDSLDGDQATLLFNTSDEAGPFGVGGVTLRTVKINGVDSGTEANALETTAGKLGIDSAASGGGEKNSWDDGESWTYEFDKDTYFDAISFGGFSSGEVFTVQANSFIGFSPIGGLGSGVSFSSASGTWTFDGNGSNDDITISDLGGLAATVAAFDDITIGYSGGSPSTLQGISSTAVPEPGSALLLLLIAGAVASRRRRN